MLKNRRVLMVSRCLSKEDVYAELEQILSIAGKRKVDLVVFALFTLDHKYMYQRAFRERLRWYSRRHKMMLVMEFTDTETLRDNVVFVFNSGQMRVFYQWFSKSGGDELWKEALLGELDNRVFNDSDLLLICGELSLGLKVDRKLGRIVDKYNFLKWLKQKQIEIILDPFHDTAVRYEVAMKRRLLSVNGRCLISVWNKNPKKHHNSKVPFQVFYDGEDVSSAVEKIIDVKIRDDIQIGFLDLKSLSQRASTYVQSSVRT